MVSENTGLAGYIMRGRKQAAIFATVATLIPMMFWFGAAAIALVTLRHGLSQGLAVFVWAIIPAMGWWLGWQDPGALIVLLSTLVMASVLRYTVSWQSALVAGGVVSLVTGLLVPSLMPELINALMTLADEVFRELAREAQVEYDDQIQGSFRSLMIASFASSFYGMAVGSLFLARSWQSRLFNPGGWQQEFHLMKLSPGLVAALVLAQVVAPILGIDSVLVMMIAVIPAVVCGLALVHGLISKKKLGGQWLFGFYFSVVMLFPTFLMLLVFLALLDSLVDFRKRIQAS